MVEFLSRVTISCFGLSYLIVWMSELVRLYLPARIPRAISYIFLWVGLFAHTTYLVLRARQDLVLGPPLANWQSWCLVAAWILVVIVVYCFVRWSKFSYGVFLLPVVLVLLAAGYLLGDLPPFSSQNAKSVWRIIHGVALLLGTVAVCVGFLTGVMYLTHAYRLKQKKAPSRAFKLPSLERLQIASEQALVISSLLLTVGLISGILINLIEQNQRELVVQWNDPVVWSSGVLLLWLIASLAFQWLYRPARHGRKVAYLVVASFIFLIVELAIVLSVNHGSVESPESAERAVAAVDHQASTSFGERLTKGGNES